jgi:hypothetical protein
MDICKYTFTELTGGIQTTGESVAMEMPMEFGQVTPFEFNPLYGTAVLTGGLYMQDQALVRKNDNGEWECIGWYMGDTMMVWADGKKGLGSELFLRCIAHRNELPVTKMMTGRGEKTMRRAHRIAIERALAEGKDVPQAVRDEYGL